MHVLIVGGGICGLTTALALEHVGISAQVFESSANLRELGVGINLQPPAVKVLANLGLYERVMETGIETLAMAWFNKFGQKIWQEPRGRATGLKWPQVSIHRGHLHSLLLDAVRQRLGADAVVTNHHFQDLEQTAEGRVNARFVERDSGVLAGAYNGDALIGADGIHSVVRRKFYPIKTTPFWNGNMIWRMAVEIDEPILGGQIQFHTGTNPHKTVGYEISAAARDRGRSLPNFIAEKRLAEPGPAPREEDWEMHGQSGGVEYFTQWRFDWMDVPAIFEQADYIWEFPLLDRDPIDQWSFGNVTLIGDAAHSMSPVGSNGGTQAIIDAEAVARQLAGGCSIDLGFAAYEQERLPITNALIAATRGGAQDKILDLVDKRAPDGFDDINAVASVAEFEAIANSYRDTARFHQTV